MTKTSSTCDGEMILDIALDSLRPLARNARTHSKKQIRQIAKVERTIDPIPKGARREE